MTDEKQEAVLCAWRIPTDEDAMKRPEVEIGDGHGLWLPAILYAVLPNSEFPYHYAYDKGRTLFVTSECRIGDAMQKEATDE